MKLFTFIQADLESFHLGHPAVSTPSDDTGQHPAYPKSLLLINPLFSAYELNSVNSAAQDSISVPEGLDLDVWIVPPPQELLMPAAAAANDSQEGVHPPTKKKIKGKGKVRSSKVATIKPHDPQTDPINPPDPLEAEERIENERVSSSVVLNFQGSNDLPASTTKKRRLERMELRRHDPYYIPDRPYSVPSTSDVDSIPVVHLDDLPPLPQGWYNHSYSPFLTLISLPLSKLQKPAILVCCVTLRLPSPPSPSLLIKTERCQKSRHSQPLLRCSRLHQLMSWARTYFAQEPQSPLR